MRFYSFVNGLYMSPLQHGLQTAHCVAEMSLQENAYYIDWAENYKTIVILNAINVAGLLELEQVLTSMIIPYPVASFREDEASLNGAITCVGIVLPEQIYEAARLFRQRKITEDTTLSFDWYSRTGTAETPEEDARIAAVLKFLNEDVTLEEKKIISLLNQYSLA